MANLSDVSRTAVWAEWMREVSVVRESAGLSKADLRAAVNAIDAWLDTNASVLNAAIPQPARTALTTAQKSRLLRLIVFKRYEEESA